jgi:hypothetical protein
MIKGKDIVVVGRHGMLKLVVIAKNIAVEIVENKVLCQFSIGAIEFQNLKERN